MDELNERTQLRLARKARRQDLKRQAILEAARAVLIDAGLEGMTTAAVARAADISAPTLYYYYPSRQALIDALALSMLQQDIARMEAAVAQASDPIDALVAMFVSTSSTTRSSPSTTSSTRGSLVLA